MSTKTIREKLERKEKSGLLTPVCRVGTNKFGLQVWKFKCDCGKEKIKAAAIVYSGMTRSCGCLYRISQTKNLAGKKFGRLYAIRLVNQYEDEYKRWECECECGNKIEVDGYLLTRGSVRSCGCLRKEYKGAAHHNWNGGKKLTSGGYVRILTSTNPRKYELEHIVVMAKHIGRPLSRFETVHHKNGIKQDNRIENLELWSSRHPKGQRVKDMISFCKEYLTMYDSNQKGEQK